MRRLDRLPLTRWLFLSHNIVECFNIVLMNFCCFFVFNRHELFSWQQVLSDISYLRLRHGLCNLLFLKIFNFYNNLFFVLFLFVFFLCIFVWCVNICWKKKVLLCLRFDIPQNRFSRLFCCILLTGDDGIC